MTKSGGILIFGGIGFCFLLYGIFSYLSGNHLAKDNVHVQATVESVHDAPVKYHNMSRFDNARMQTFHSCDYTLKFRRPEESSDTTEQVKIFGMICLRQGMMAPIVYDPQNPKDISLDFKSQDAAPIGKILLSLGAIMVGFSCIGWVIQKR